MFSDFGDSYSIYRACELVLELFFRVGWDGLCIETRPQIPFECLGWILLLVLILVIVALFQIFGLDVSEVYWVPPSNEWVP